MRMKWRIWMLAAISGGFLSGQAPRVSIVPTTPPNRAADNHSTAKLRVDSNLVLVPVVVTDAVDRPVLGLDKTAFRLYDDKQEQQITHFAMEDAPVSVILVFDTSGSMGKKLQTSRAAVSEFLKASNPEDEFALIEFADQPRLALKFTDNGDEIANQLLFLQSHGRTALIDALYMALHYMKSARHTRKAVVIISDGGDNRSRYTRSELKRRVREADVQIYSIGIMEPPSSRDATEEEAAGASLLDEMAKLSGGRFFEAESQLSMAEIARRIGSALRNQYVLGYSPSPGKQDGRYHRISVKLERAKGEGKVRTSFRSSYLSPSR
jgi:VWFA-related protein